MIHTPKALLICNIVDEQYSHCAPVVRRRDRPEPLLACRIPYLQLDALAVKVYGSDLEVDADGCDEGGCEAVFGEAKETAGFADAGVAY